MKKILLSAMAIAAITTTAMASDNVSDIVSISNINPYVIYKDYSSSDIFKNKKIVGVKSKVNVQNAGAFDIGLKYVNLDRSETTNPHKWVFDINYGFNLNGYHANVGGKYLYINMDGIDDNDAYSFWVGAMSKTLSEDAANCKLGVQFYYSDLSNLMDDLDVWQVDFIAKKMPVHTKWGSLTMKNVVSYVKLGTDNFDGKDDYLTDTLSASLKQGKVSYRAAVSFGKQAWKVQNTSYGIDTTGNVHKWGVAVGAGYKIDSVSKINIGIGYDKVDSGEDSDIKETTYSLSYNYSF